ncbi:hypothetical protein [Coleofasciculus sp. FACHB-SPT36]|uniref:hypothetical protein n=1 Tax=Cyanophyceae TaxID=3028117 RepID=UPI00168BBC7B|nr:hypothetical protein [Coleofasciculus sp. FACHB-SPT36]MBD2538074.1 hypothetical protein [Coleofasciculus sp. FACHB-SPT36]
MRTLWEASRWQAVDERIGLVSACQPVFSVCLCSFAIALDTQNTIYLLSASLKRIGITSFFLSPFFLTSQSSVLTSQPSVLPPPFSYQGLPINVKAAQ